MNGGTIPSNRSQYVTFFNTTGVIERHKNMYYVPRFSQNNIGVNQTVANTYYDLFQRVCPPSSVYAGIQVSSWSPEDRTLVVQGNIDDFRCITDEGECLNYVVVTRTVTKGQNTQVIYYAFFISDAKQSGGSSITLTLIPDDFTNVFYLHNNHVLTQSDLNNDYEPFNEHMKNCYVKRQHYNRVEISNLITIGTTTLIEEKLKIGEDYLLKINNDYYAVGINGYKIAGSTVSLDIEAYDEIDFSDYSGAISIQLEDSNGTVVIIGTSSYYRTGYSYSKNKVFLEQQESYKFKYQYRDLKYPLSMGESFTNEEIQEIELNDSFSSLSQNLRKKILLSCISYVVIETKSNEPLAYIWHRSNNSSNWAKHNNIVGDYSNNIRRPNNIMASPIILVPEVFNKYETDIENFDLRIGLIDSVYGTTSKTKWVFSNIINNLKENSMSDYVYSCYLVNDLCLKKDIFEFDFTGNHIHIMLTVGLTDENGRNIDKTAWLGAFYYDITFKEDDTKGIFYERLNSSPYTIGPFDYFGCRPMICPSNCDFREYKIFISEKTESISSYIKNDYYDPVLETEPYSFYALSLFNSEMVFNKGRYYTGMYSVINAKYCVHCNGGIKYIIAPIYTVEDYKTTYFNEGITMTLACQFPLVSDSYSQYYYQNMSQMKNQFAVNDYSRGVDLLQHALVSGPNAVGYSAGKGGINGGGAGAGFGALLETGNQVMQMVDEAIDWSQSTKIIEMTQKAKLADMGRRPDTLKQAGSEVYSDLTTKEMMTYLNHYTIDRLSYNSIAKLLERTGYQVNLYDTLHIVDRVGWNYVQLNGFDYEAEITVSQEDTIRKIFSEGVTLLHDKTYLTSGHNYETILDE